MRRLILIIGCLLGGSVGASIGLLEAKCSFSCDLFGLQEAWGFVDPFNFTAMGVVQTILVVISMLFK